MNKIENAIRVCGERPFQRSTTLALALACGIICLGQKAQAVNGTWINAAGGNYSAPANWLNGVVANGANDGSDATANFNTLDVPTTGIPILLDAPYTLANLNFADTDPSTAGSWTFSSGGDPFTLANPVSAATTMPTINVGAGSTATFDSTVVITGSNGLIKSGAGNLVIQGGANTYTGGTRIDAGTVSYATTLATASTTLGTGDITLNGGTLAFTANNNLILANNIVIAGNSTISANATSNRNVQLNGNFSGSGTVNINILNAAAETFTIGANNLALANFTGTINLGASIGVFRLQGGGTNGLTLGNAAMTVNTGTGTVIFRERNSPSTVLIGALMGGAGTSIGPGTQAAGGAVTTYMIGSLNTNTTFDGFLRSAANVTAAGFGSATGLLAINKVGSGSLTLTNTGNTYLGATTVGTSTDPGGTLIAQGDGTLGASPTITINAGGQLTLTAGVTNNYIANNANVFLLADSTGTTKGVINLNFTGTADTINMLTVGGTPINPGTYTASSPETAGYLTGTGSLLVLAVVPEPSTWAMIVIGGAGLCLMSRRGRRRQAVA